MNKEAMDAAVHEWVAREYCQLMGLDPDEFVALPSMPPGSLVLRKGPQWKALEGQVRSALAMQMAIERMRALPCHPIGTVTAIGEPPIGADGKPDWSCM